jgi:hypothetical protein
MFIGFRFSDQMVMLMMRSLVASLLQLELILSRYRCIDYHNANKYILLKPGNYSLY